MGIRVAKFFLQNFLTVLRNFPSKQNITANRYYGSCQRNEYIFSKYFGHPTTFISVIFLPKLETNSDLQNLFLTHSTLNACGENPTYIFLIPSLLNSTMTEEIPLTRSTSKIFVIHGDDRNASGASFTLIAILLTRFALRNGATLAKAVGYFIKSWQWILSSLTGQYHGTPRMLRLVPSFPLLVIISLFAFFLVGTVFYQSSMFSSLVALTPPRLPSTLKSVVESKIQIITTTMTNVNDQFFGVAAGSENATRYPTRYPQPSCPYPHGYPLSATRYEN
ncbi:hypothetical protein Fcan01_16232 [Folsomia candida]|uniref:Uncharacterized protein n=1 Tax=Folsomia candida TaxID=158441 RepID=A0A226DV17_FOLCA|nr:hypothetical protein Fcan01_16232 [Folsomia candida]